MFWVGLAGDELLLVPLSTVPFDGEELLFGAISARKQAVLGMQAVQVVRFRHY